MSVDTHSVLVITKDSKVSSLINTMLVAPVFDTTIVSDFNEAKRLCVERVYNIILADWADGEGIDFALSNSDSISTIIILAPSAHFEEISYRVETNGILTMSTPFDAMYFYNFIKVAIAVKYKVQMLSSKTTKLQDKMEEIRLVNRAKMILMQNNNMTESEAHHYIEKEAMDRCEKRTKVATRIISTYGS